SGFSCASQHRAAPSIRNTGDEYQWWWSPASVNNSRSPKDLRSHRDEPPVCGKAKRGAELSEDGGARKHEAPETLRFRALGPGSGGPLFYRRTPRPAVGRVSCRG